MTSATELRARIRHADVACTNLAVLPNDVVGYPVRGSGGDQMTAHA